MLRPGASNQASRRAHAMGLQFMDLRTKAVEDALLAANLPRISERIQKTAATDNPASPGDDGAVVVTIVQRKRQK